MAKTAKVEAPTLEEFAKMIIAEDELGSVLRAHLVIEFHVDELLEALAPNPAALARMSLDYFGKVRLLGVLGITDNLLKPLANIGTLRNSFAHQLNYSLSRERMNTLYECFDAEGKQIVHGVYQDTRKKFPQSEHPNSMWSLSPKDQFLLFAASIRAMLHVALEQAKAA